jgi:GGDEF domain-containing protein
LARITVVTSDFLSKVEQRLRLEAKGHQLVSSQDLSRTLENLVNDPPDILIIQKNLSQGLDKLVIQALKNNLQLVLFPILLVISERDFTSGLDWNDCPVDDLISDQATLDEIVMRIDLALARSHRVADNNPLTKLPGNSSILKNIQGILDAGSPKAVGYVDIDNFKPYNDRYGFARGDEVIRMVARILVNVMQENAGTEGFVGHVGGDDFVFTTLAEDVETVCQQIIKNFSALIPLFLDEKELDAGCFAGVDRKGRRQSFPLTSISIAVVICAGGRYRHYGEVAAVAAQLKKQVKKLQGSNYFIDRRRSP